MTPTLLPELAAKSFVVAGAALILIAATRKRSAAERSWVAHAALGVLLALPVASLWLPRWRLLAPREPETILPATAQAAAAATLDPGVWLGAIYVAIAAAFLCTSIFAVAGLFRLRRDASVVVDAGWLTALARAQARMGIKTGAALLTSPTVTSPVSWGLVRPTIVLNEELVGASADAEAVIAHELAHVARLDWAKLLIGRIVVALFWFNPLVWSLARHCHQLREEAADDAVLAAQVRSTDYAALLVEAARHECRGLIAAHGVAPASGSLHRRVTRVLDAAARRTPTGAGWAVGSLIGAALLAAPLAAATVERDAPTAQTIHGAAAVTPPRPVVETRTAAAYPPPVVEPRPAASRSRLPKPVVKPRTAAVPPKPVVKPRSARPPAPVVKPRKAAPTAASPAPAKTFRKAKVTANAPGPAVVSDKTQTLTTASTPKVAGPASDGPSTIAITSKTLPSGNTVVTVSGASRTISGPGGSLTSANTVSAESPR